MFVTLKLLILSYSDISGVLPGERDDDPRRACLPSLGGTTAAWPCQPQTFSSNCSSPLSLPSNFPCESCSSWCFGISQLWWFSSLSASTAPIFACFAGVLPAGTCNPWDGWTSAPVELVALLSLVLAEREVGCWLKAPAFSELGVAAGTWILRRREVPGYWQTKYQDSFVFKTTLNLNIN